MTIGGVWVEYGTKGMEGSGAVAVAPLKDDGGTGGAKKGSKIGCTGVGGMVDNL